jgi:hypothetical protein
MHAYSERLTASGTVGNTCVVYWLAASDGAPSARYKAAHGAPPTQLRRCNIALDANAVDRDGTARDAFERSRVFVHTVVIDLVAAGRSSVAQ